MPVSIFITFVLAGRLASVTSQNDTRLPDIGYLGLGYDLYMGNPLEETTAEDPGLREAVFDLTNYSQQKMTPDNRYLIPDGTEVTICTSCDFQFAAENITSVNTYQKEISFHVSIDIQPPAPAPPPSPDDSIGDFSGSVTYDQIRRETSERKVETVSATASCVVYCAGNEEFTMPKFSANFKAGLASLPVTYDEEKYFAFLNTFGTHAMKHIEMGAIYRQTSKIESESWRNLEGSHFDFQAAVQGTALSSVSPTLVSDSTKNATQLFEHFRKSSSLFTRGSRPPKDGQVSSWMQQTFTDPAPLNYRIRDLASLIETSQQWDGPSTVAENVRKATKAYCQELKKKGNPVQCTKEPDPGPLPAVKMCVGESDTYGGQGKVQPSFHDKTSIHPSYLEAVERVFVRTGKRLVGQTKTRVIYIQAQTTDGTNYKLLDGHGGGQGEESVFYVPLGDAISSVNVNICKGGILDKHDRVCSVQFFTQQGLLSPVYGDGGGQTHVLSVSQKGAKLLGFKGSSGDEVDALGGLFSFPCNTTEALSLQYI